MSTPEMVVALQGVSKVFPKGGVTALEEIDLEVNRGEFVSLIGPSGCGKSTLLRVIGDLAPPTAGDVLVNGKSAERARLDRDYGIVFQAAVLYDWRTVAKNIALPLELLKWDKTKRNARVGEMLELVELTGFDKHYPWQLSGGMQQRVAIARAYALDPAVLLMDEPFGALDAQTRTVMQEELVRLARRNPRTVLFITHAVEEAVYLADRVVVMTRRPGRIREIIDVGAVRRSENWDRLERIEEVMDQASFVHMRTQIWRLLREQQQPDEH
jgi:NitT/TauT family transport system ATP-binding protein